MATPFVFNIAKGKVARYADLPDATDSLILVQIKTTGIEADATLQDYDTLAAILAAANDEADFTGYSRITLAGVVSTPQDTPNVMRSDADDPGTMENTGGSAQGVSAAFVCYKPASGSADSAIVPLVQILDGAVTYDPNVPVNIATHANGFFEAA